MAHVCSSCAKRTFTGDSYGTCAKCGLNAWCHWVKPEPGITFRPHPAIPSLLIIKINGVSIIIGPPVAPGFELMDTEGEVHKHLTAEQVWEKINVTR